MPLLENVQSLISLDVYDHDTTQETIKSIACDDNSRYVAAQLTERGEPYYLPSDAQVVLTVLRPDKAGVGIEGTTFPYTRTYTVVVQPEDEEEEATTEEVEETVYGAYAELDQSAIAIAGYLYAQFKITVGTQILRTEIFKINNGRALDAEISDWSGVYQGYNLDVMAEKLDFILNALQDIVGDDVDIDSAIADTHSYVDLKTAQLQSYVDQQKTVVEQKLSTMISVHDNGIYIVTQ
ncbi:MAG: hypothetical protein IJ844_02040 [Prevotella sp.]|nr:hypothetical protein [Prevotella sp.]